VHLPLGAALPRVAARARPQAWVAPPGAHRHLLPLCERQLVWGVHKVQLLRAAAEAGAWWVAEAGGSLRGLGAVEWGGGAHALTATSRSLCSSVLTR
jgi:hypothetical protein